VVGSIVLRLRQLMHESAYENSFAIRFTRAPGGTSTSQTAAELMQ